MVDVVEGGIDGGEADVGNGVEFAEAVHHDLPEPGGGDLGLIEALEVFGNGIDEFGDAFAGDRALAAGREEAAFKLGGVELFAVTVALDEFGEAALDALVGGEARAAEDALPAAAYGAAIIGDAAVDDLVVVFAAVGAEHG